MHMFFFFIIIILRFKPCHRQKESWKLRGWQGLMNNLVWISFTNSSSVLGKGPVFSLDRNWSKCQDFLICLHFSKNFFSPGLGQNQTSFSTFGSFQAILAQGILSPFPAFSFVVVSAGSFVSRKHGEAVKDVGGRRMVLMTTMNPQQPAFPGHSRVCPTFIFKTFWSVSHQGLKRVPRGQDMIHQVILPNSLSYKRRH